MQTTFLLNSLTDTADFARRMAREVQPGYHIGLVGPLGAGKTTFVQTFAQALGAQTIPESPTFVLRQAYPLPDGRQLVHVDLYRLEDPVSLEDLAQIGILDDWHNPQTIIVIEWADKCPQIQDQFAALVRFEVNSATDSRIARLERSVQ